MDLSSDSDDEVLYPYVEADNVNLMNYEDPLMMSPLLRAIKANDQEAAVAFIKAGRYLTSFDNNQSTPLHYAVQQQNLVIIDLLLQSPKVDTNFKNLVGSSPLHIAVQHSSDVIVKHLLEKPCNVNITNTLGQTPLHLAFIHSSVAIAHELIKAGADIDCQDFNGFTPLHQAVENKDLEGTCMLLYYNIDVTIQCSNGLTAFMIAVNDRSKLQIARTLLNYYDDFSATTCDKYTALLLAANNLSPIAVEIVKAGADVNYVPDEPILFNSVLYFSLYYPNAELFNEVWKTTDFQLIPQIQHFVITFLRSCKFGTKEWVQCMYRILNSSLISLLMDDFCMGYSRCTELIPLNLLISLFLRNVPVHDRLAIISVFLSFGTEVCMCVMNAAYALFGVNEEFDLLLNCGDFVTECVFPITMFPMAEFVLGQEPFLIEQDEFFIIPEHFSSLSKYGSKVTFICENFRTLSQSIYNYDEFFEKNYINYCKRRSVLQAVGHFFLPSFVKYDISLYRYEDLTLKEEFTEKLKSVAEFPSLVELARDQIQRNIKQNIKTDKPYYYYKAIKQLQLPKVLQDVLFFNKPLYS